ncbi:hypothetical protein Q5572_24400, partial [Escherichia coli]|nr:hypothetical protein [Escherichia coli]
QDNAALAEQVKALGANPVTATGEPVPQMPASPPGPEGEPQPGNTPVTMTALSPVWLDSRSRYLRDMYRPGMVMEQWNPETRSHDRYVIDRVTAQSNSLTLRDAQGETQVVRISSLDSSWSLFRPEKMPVADGERL